MHDHSGNPQHPASDTTPLTRLPSVGVAAQAESVEPVTEDSLWQKITRAAKRAGREVVEKALWLHYAAQRPETPAWARTMIYGALAYFILPVDMIPDVVPLAGYSDDLGVLAAAVATLAVYINQDVKDQAARKLQDWFG